MESGLLSEISSYPHFRSQESPSKTHKIPSNSSGNEFLYKAIIVLVLLIVISLSPFQSHDSGSVFSDFWEIFHLAFVGIAVSYGVFSTKTTQMDSGNDDFDSYFSGISYLSPFVEFGFGGLLENDWGEKDESFVGDECDVQKKNVKSCESNDYDGKKWSREWRLQSVRGESLVVVSDAKCFRSEISDFKPLNLPIRSLKSSIVDESELDFSESWSPKPEVFEVDDDIEGIVAENLNLKFEEADIETPSPPRPHFRHRSVGDYEFDHFDSTSFCSSPELRSSRGGNFQRKIVLSGYKPLSRNNYSDLESKPESESEYDSESSFSYETHKQMNTLRARKEISSQTNWEDKKFSRRLVGKRGGSNHLHLVDSMQRPDSTLGLRHSRREDQQQVSEFAEDRTEQKVKSKERKERKDIFSDAEVDRKAGEFIAKFRRQIRHSKDSPIITRKKNFLGEKPEQFASASKSLKLFAAKITFLFICFS